MPRSDAVAITRNVLDKLATRTLDYWNRRGEGPPAPYRPGVPRNCQFCRVTGVPIDCYLSGNSGSGTYGSGACSGSGTTQRFRYWPAVVVAYDAVAEVETDLGTCWLMEVNSHAFKIGTQYFAIQSGQICINNDTRILFRTDRGIGTFSCASGSGSGSGNCGIPIGELVRCVAGMTQARDACLRLGADGVLELVTPQGVVIARA